MGGQCQSQPRPQLECVRIGSGVLGEQRGGVLGHQFSPDVGDGETDWQGNVISGAGLGFRLGGLLSFVTGSYVCGFNETTYFGVGAGISIPLGGDDR